MAALLFIYSRTSIRAAKRNAQRHREADGGQISWYNESQRRHGALERPGAGETETVGQVREMVGELRGQGSGRGARIERDSAVRPLGREDKEREVVERLRGLKGEGGRKE